MVLYGNDEGVAPALAPGVVAGAAPVRPRSLRLRHPSQKQ